ncbi:acyl-CoA dehydrogenase family protein [Tsuneonella sp. HG249]
MTEFLGPFEAMLEALFPPRRLREIIGEGDWGTEHQELERSGFLDALTPESAGGAGLAFQEVIPLWMSIGLHAAPLEIGQAMIDRAGVDLEQAEWARAVLLAAVIAGAAHRVLAMSVDYANHRVQFGKPVGRQQAVQQQLALMAEKVMAARFVVHLAADGPGWPTQAKAAAAKTVAAMYASDIANTAHAVHGAIGISAEHDLQIYTRRMHEWRLAGGAEKFWGRRLGERLLASSDDSLGWMRAELFD